MNVKTMRSVVPKGDQLSNLRMTRFAFKRRQKVEEKQQQMQHKKSDVEKGHKNPIEVSINQMPRYFREFTQEEKVAYRKKMEESEGFDVWELPHDLRLHNVIKRYMFGSDSYSVDYFIRVANLSLRGFNKQHHTKYRAVELVRVNFHGVCGVEYYITFQAKDRMANNEIAGSPCNFQSRVLVFMGKISIKFCRKEKKSELSKGPGEA